MIASAVLVGWSGAEASSITHGQATSIHTICACCTGSVLHYTQTLAASFRSFTHGGKQELAGLTTTVSVLLQMPKELALRFCAAAEPYMSSALSDWAAASASQDAETRSTALLQVCASTVLQHPGVT